MGQATIAYFQIRNIYLSQKIQRHRSFRIPKKWDLKKVNNSDTDAGVFIAFKTHLIKLEQDFEFEEAEEEEAHQFWKDVEDAKFAIAFMHKNIEKNRRENKIE